MVFVLEGVPVPEVRAVKSVATQRLLGATIAMSDEDWQKPSTLPSWTRAHVAAHLCLGAEHIQSLLPALTQGRDAARFMDVDAEFDKLERGSEQNGLDLQIQLDTTAVQLKNGFDLLTAADWDLEVSWPDYPPITAAALPLARLFEVTMHHVDLDIGFSIHELDDEVAGWLLAWAVIRRPMSDFPVDADVWCPDGLHFRIGRGGRDVRGTRQQILGWLSGREADERILAQATELPPL